MKQKGLRASMALIIFLAAASGLWAARNYKVLNGPERTYYGHISYTEVKADGKDPVVIREGQVTGEVAVLNLPVGPGDTIQTPADRRSEIQFDTGTIIRLDFDTELKIETILAHSLSASTQLSNLVLSRGRIYIMYREYDSREMFQVLTPLAAFKLSHKTVATIRAAADGSTDAQVKFGKASMMFGPDEKALQKQTIKSKERLTLISASQFQRTAYLPDSDFELWNDDINARFDELHKGLSGLPKPIQKLPPAVFYFAQQYGNIYGEWLWDDMYGYVWRPFLNRMDYPWGWAPYYYGQWSDVGGQMYWVPEEPWGWVPYHLGIWQWDKKLGWVWLPGSLFAPAWVDWEFFFGSFGWRPWSLFDWFDGFYTDFVYWNDGWNYVIPGGPWTGPFPGGKPALTSIGRNKLQKPPSPLPLPQELKSVYKNVLTAYKKGDPRVVESAKQVPSQTVFVSKANLNSPKIQDKAMTWDKLPKLDGVPPAKTGQNSVRKLADPGQAADQAYRGNQALQQILHRAEVPGRIQKTAGRPAVAPAPLSRAESASRRPVAPDTERVRTNGRPAEQTRFLDWNPDIKVARQLGVRIEYSSRKNEIRCPELNLSSRDREGTSDRTVPHLTSRGISYGPATSVDSGGSYVGGGSSSSGGGGPISGRSSGSVGVQGSTKEGSSSGGEGGKIKN